MSYWRICTVVCIVVLILLAGCQPADNLPETASLPEQANTEEAQVQPAESPDVAEGEKNPWQVIRTIEVDHRPSLAAFMNQDFGITNCAGLDREVFYTSDGGESWTESETKPG